MLIEKVHGLQATSITLDERFTMLTKVAPARVATRQRRRPLIGTYNKKLIDQIAWHLEQQAKRNALRYRVGFPEQAPLRRFGSESNLPGLRRSNSFGNLTQRNVKDRLSWRQSNGNLSSGSFNNFSPGAWRARLMRGYRRRGVGQQPLRGRVRGGGGGGLQAQGRVGRAAGWGARGGAGGAGGAAAGRGRGRPQTARRGNPKWGRAKGAGRSPAATKEALDLELDQYMACTRLALDADLDSYMKNAMEDE